MKTERSKVLVVGDDGVDTNTVFKVLHRHGHRVDRACDMRNAFSADLSEYTAIIVDEDRFEGASDCIVAELRHRVPVAGIVIMASLQNDDQTLASRYDGADDCLTKPVTANQLRLSMAG